MAMITFLGGLSSVEDAVSLVSRAALWTCMPKVKHEIML